MKLDVLDLTHLPGKQWLLEQVMNSTVEIVNMEDNYVDFTGILLCIA
jgi:hypothetical protein